jgi:hypothetical protein
MIVGYAIGPSIAARLTVAALKAALARREPPPGCIHHSDRGSQGGFNWSSQHSEGGDCDEYPKAAIGSVWAGATGVAGATDCGGTPRTEPVLVAIAAGVNGALELTHFLSFRRFQSDPPAILTAASRSGGEDGYSVVSFTFAGRAMMPARRLSFSR